MRQLRREQRGAATIEFALWSVLFFMVAVVALDFGLFTIQRGHLSEALSGASIAAFSKRDTVDYSAIPAYIQAVSAVPNAASMSIAVGCNGGSNNCTNTSRTCACLSQSGTFVPAGSCGEACGAGSTPNSISGYYLTIGATYPFKPMFMTRGILGNKPITQTATVRLQ
jgi:Flp pilus assembly protein TadG